jgi:preprotein translocase subunit YajC
MSFFISSALADVTTGAAPAAQQQGSLASVLIPMIAFLAFFYFFILRPQNKRNKELRDLIAGLSKGDEVATTGGLLGKVVRVADDFVVVEVADGTEIKFQKTAVAAVLPKGTLKTI